MFTKQEHHHLSHKRGFMNIFWFWPPAVILLISASQVAKITGVSHWYLALFFIFVIYAFGVIFKLSLPRPV
jgi:hypothetical protein